MDTYAALHTPRSLPRPDAATSARDAASEWISRVRSHSLTLEHAAIDIDTDHVLYHMEIEFETPLPPQVLDIAAFLCLSWPYGGLWKIEKVSDDNTKVSCLAWRKTDLTHDDMDDYARNIRALTAKIESLEPSGEPRPDERVEAETNDMLPHLFAWQMMHGSWGHDDSHWFLHDTDVEPHKPLTATLFVDFAPLEARIEVNAITAIDTIAQTYDADVTWQVTFPAITTLRQDTVLLEFLDLLDIDVDQFEFANVNDMKDERALASSVTPAGQVEFQGLAMPGTTQSSVDQVHVESVYHLQFSRRIVATFTDEMTLHSFPFDQQKLVFELSTGASGMPDDDLELIPAALDPGSFSIDDYQLANVFDVAYYNKIFVGKLTTSGPRKAVAFELVLERRSYYYLMNVALIAAVITYLCFFVSWSPENGSNGGLQLMDMGSRLQNVTAMVLTAVMFKNQVSSLIPQISYFTMLDRYVFVCFMVTSLVTIENALFPLLERYVIGERFGEGGLLGYSLVAFTIFNVAWAIYVHRWLARRRQAARVLMQVREYIRLITDLIPAKDRQAVLERFLDKKNLAPWCRPSYIVLRCGDIHIQVPDDVPVTNAAATHKRLSNFEQLQQDVIAETPLIQKLYTEMRPGKKPSRQIAPLTGRALSSPGSRTIPAARTTTKAYQAGAMRMSRMATMVMNGQGTFRDTRRRMRWQRSANDAVDDRGGNEPFGGRDWSSSLPR